MEKQTQDGRALGTGQIWIWRYLGWGRGSPGMMAERLEHGGDGKVMLKYVLGKYTEMLIAFVWIVRPCRLVGGHQRLGKTFLSSPLR